MTSPDFHANYDEQRSAWNETNDKNRSEVVKEFNKLPLPNALMFIAFIFILFFIITKN